MVISIRLETDGHVLRVDRMISEDRLRQARSPAEMLREEFAIIDTIFRQQLVMFGATYNGG